jgi:riboflavin-specific deaminase-like protein
VTTSDVAGRGSDQDPYADHVLPAGRDDVPWWVAVSMIATVDGATTIRGRSRALGGEADARVLRRLRAASDVVLVGAGTVRAEDYGPLRVAPDQQERRRRAGLEATPRLAIVTATGALAPAARVFSSPAHRPLVLLPEAARAETTRALGEVADVIACGEQAVDLRRALEALAERDLRRVLVEGGPTINAQLVAHDLVDEVFLTLDPCLVGGDSPRAAQGTASPAARTLELVSAIPAGRDLLLRYRRDRSGQG